MNTTRTYHCNLRGIDVSEYKRNPIVLRSHNYAELPIGRATILKGKTRVRVKFTGAIPSYPHTLGTATYSKNQEPPRLLDLSVIPVVEMAA
jgi:hypothetical protein